MATQLPLIVIVGPTASGKTDLAIKLAQKYRGEIICADSRTVYKDMNIGTAKPSVEEQASIPHWGIDLAEPSRRYTVAEFQNYAKAKIDDIRGRGNIPFLVGGTGLYVDSVVFDYQFSQPINKRELSRLDSLSREELYDYCVKNNIKLPDDIHNKRRLVQAIARPDSDNLRKSKPTKNTFVVGITISKQLLIDRIWTRTEHMFEHGVVEEAIMLGKKYGWSSEAMTGNVYPIIREYLHNELSFDEAKEKFATRDRQLAKRQLTWFRRNPFTEWCSLSEAEKYLVATLASEYNL